MSDKQFVYILYQYKKAKWVLEKREWASRQPGRTKARYGSFIYLFIYLFIMNDRTRDDSPPYICP